MPKRSLGVSQHGAVIADAVAIYVIANFDVVRGAGLELRDAGERPVIDDIAHNLHSAFGVPHGGGPDVREHQPLAMIVLRRAPISESTVSRIGAELVRGLVGGGEDLRAVIECAP